MEGAVEVRFRRAVDSNDMQQQSKSLDKLTDRVEDLRLDSSRVRLDMGSVAASKETDDDDESMSESESEGEESDEEEGEQYFFSKEADDDDDDESMSESESEGEESDEEEGEQYFFSKPLMKIFHEQEELKWNAFLEKHHQNFMRKLRETDD